MHPQTLSSLIWSSWLIDMVHKEGPDTRYTYQVLNMVIRLRLRSIAISRLFRLRCMGPTSRIWSCAPLHVSIWLYHRRNSPHLPQASHPEYRIADRDLSNVTRSGDYGQPDCRTSLAPQGGSSDGPAGSDFNSGHPRGQIYETAPEGHPSCRDPVLCPGPSPGTLFLFVPS